MDVARLGLLAQSIRLALGGLVIICGNATAQARDDEAIPVDRITGSRIARAQGQSSSPILVIYREQIEQTGLVSLGTLLQELPIAGAALNTRFNGGGNGQTHLDLRNLGSNRVLILINGRRVISGIGGRVDLNNIPTAIVQRLEILKDGAAAIYGSDAITGVVNVITRDDFEGLEANAYMGQFEAENDGETQAFDFSVGSGSDRGSVFFNASYVKAEPVFAGDREISREPQFGTGLAFGSSFTPQGRFGAFALGSLGLTTDPGTNVTGPGGLGAAAFRIGDFSAGSSGSGSDRFNNQPDMFMLTPQERTSVFTQGTYALTDEVQVVVEASYHQRTSAQRFSPALLALGLFGANIGARIGVPADNRYNPFGIDLNPSSFLLARRLVEAGPRIFQQDVDSYRFVLGLAGNFDFGQRQFDWDVSYVYSDLRQVNSGSRRLNMARVQQALSGQPCRDDSNNDGCVELNVFGGQGADGMGTIIPDMLDYILFAENSSLGNVLRDYAAGVTGELLQLPAGPLGVAAGYEYRQEEGFDSPDSLVQAGLTSGAVILPINGSFQVDTFYLEFAVPLLAGVRGAERLDLSLSTRYSDYDSFGATTNSKIGIQWQPINDLLLRATWSEGFRAPSIVDLFLTGPVREAGFFDPCNGIDSNADGTPDTNPGHPGCAGVPGNYQQLPGGVIRTTVGSNPRLQPETSESVTAGFAYSPAWLKGLDIAVDYYRIELDNLISRFGVQTIVSRCAFTGTSLCGLVTRDATSGAVTHLLVAPGNVGSSKVAGADLQVSYGFGENPWGDFGVVWNTAYQGTNEERVAKPGTADFNLISRIGRQSGAAYARFKSHLDLNWQRGNWEAAWALHYIHGTDERCGIPASFGFCNLDLDGDGDPSDGRRIGSTTYHDVQVSYAISRWDTRLTVGVRNLFDKGPPLATSAFGYSFNQADYRVPGQYPYVRLSVDF